MLDHAGAGGESCGPSDAGHLFAACTLSLEPPGPSMAPPSRPSTGPLADLRVFDLTRILAGPTCTQLLGDLGADVIKIERPGAGDDTRKWGPPYVQDKDGKDTAESAYYLSSNRNKRSLAVDISKPAGQALARRLIGQCDIMVENF